MNRTAGLFTEERVAQFGHELMPMLQVADSLRRAQGKALEALGFGPDECGYRVLATGPHWRLRAYGGGRGAAVLMVPAPIKRPYIWDLAPSVSAVRLCLRQGLRVYLLEWLPPQPGQGNAGLDDYADQAIVAAVATIAGEAGGERPFLIGHSLGGTFAAIAGALEPQSLHGLVLLGSPLCFRPGSSPFRDSLVAIAPSALSDVDIVPGSLLSQISALAAPDSFIWSRMRDAALSVADPHGLDIQTRVERWALDEVPLPGRLVDQILGWLYREDRLCRGVLPVRGGTVGPSSLRLPTLAVVNTADEVAPPDSVRPFIEAMPGRDARVIEYAGETGVGLQHLAILAGRNAYARVWPEMLTWLSDRR
ncbi:MAG TPA: alpha/beta fold hydrolase [Candidatus Acidoferrum sp.]|nr:alpha/beta fold hydrolase [Candidatus Acidoferrum sp.]